jgi:hypothetical protein
VAADTLGSEIDWIRRLGESARELSVVAGTDMDFEEAIKQQIDSCRAGLRLPPLGEPIAWF